MSHIRWAVAFLLIACGLAGCRLDDDASYEIRTYASFFMVRTTTGDLSLYRYDRVAHRLEADWNAGLGLPNADLSDVDLRDNQLWLASGPQRAVLQVSPTYGSVQERFESLPLEPHHIAIGTSQILVSDTISDRIAFVRRRNGDVQVVDPLGKPGTCVYNSGKFFLCLGGSKVVVYDEKALSPRATIETGMVIDELLLNKYHVLQVMGHDSSDFRLGIVDVNGDFLVGGATNVVPYAKFRPTQYFVQRYGEEYLFDLQWVSGNVVNQNAVMLADSVAGFEADFFEGTLFYQRGSWLVARTMADQSLIDSLAFTGTLLTSLHQYAPE